MLIPQSVTKESGFVGVDCAFCKEPFSPGEELVICHVDATPHHTFCWEANGNHCSSLGCHGHAVMNEVISDARLSAEIDPPDDFLSLDEPDNDVEDAPETPEATAPAAPPVRDHRRRGRSNSQPSSDPADQPYHFRFAQSCLMFAIAIAIIVMAFSCFGLWAILDYIMLDVLDTGYRPLP